MMELLHSTDVRLGLVTNGEHWMLVDAPRGETTGFASWYAHLWLEEQLTQRAFRSLLGVRRFFGVADDETLEAMLAESATNQQEVTDQLGLQVRHAVEVLIHSLDRADQDHGRELLAGVPETVLYEAALTVMMRLVFLFCAEEQKLLLLGDPLLRPALRRLDARGPASGSRRPARRRGFGTPSGRLGPLAGHLPRHLRRRAARADEAAGLQRQPVQPRPVPIPGRPQAGHVLARHAHRPTPGG